MYYLLTFLVLGISAILYRSGRVLRHNIITNPSLPVLYFHQGNASEQCELVVDPVNRAMRFCEDAAFWDQVDDEDRVYNRLLVVSCDPHRTEWNTVMGPLRNPVLRGALWLYDPDSASHVTPVQITFVNFPPTHDFHPLGIDIVPSRLGSPSTLFAVNHARSRTVIEQFLLDPADPIHATWVRTLSHPFFVSPNGIALTSPTSFYVSNDHFFTRRLPWPLGEVLPMIESILGLPLSWVAHVSFEEPEGKNGDIKLHHEFVAMGISFANGVSISPDGSTLAIASTSLGEVHFYSRGSTPSKLTYTHTIPVPFLPDNLVFDDQGSLLVAGHPHFPSLIHLSKNADPIGDANVDGAHAGSWAVSISSRSPSSNDDASAPVPASSIAAPMGSHAVETLVQSKGGKGGFSSSCTALRDERGLYLAGLYQEGILVCRP